MLIRRELEGSLARVLNLVKRGEELTGVPDVGSEEGNESEKSTQLLVAGGCWPLLNGSDLSRVEADARRRYLVT
jgi:hypothetical protein